MRMNLCIACSTTLLYADSLEPGSWFLIVVVCVRMNLDILFSIFVSAIVCLHSILVFTGKINKMYSSHT